MAESSYPDELAAWVARANKKRRQDAAAVAFLAVRGDVKAAMDVGYAVTTIYEHMHETGRVRCSYETFRKYVRRYEKVAAPPPPATPPDNQVKGAKPEPKAAPPVSEPKSEPPKIGGFTFDATPRKEDLL